MIESGPWENLNAEIERLNTQCDPKIVIPGTSVPRVTLSGLIGMTPEEAAYAKIYGSLDEGFNDTFSNGHTLGLFSGAQID